MVFFCDHLNGNSEMRYLEVSLFFNFFISVFNRIGIILPQNKDIEFDFVRWIQPVFSEICNQKVLKIVNLAFDFLVGNTHVQEIDRN